MPKIIKRKVIHLIYKQIQSRKNCCHPTGTIQYAASPAYPSGSHCTFQAAEVTQKSNKWLGNSHENFNNNNKKKKKWAADCSGSSWILLVNAQLFFLLLFYFCCFLVTLQAFCLGNWNMYFTCSISYSRGECGSVLRLEKKNCCRCETWGLSATPKAYERRKAESCWSGLHTCVCIHTLMFFAIVLFLPHPPASSTQGLIKTRMHWAAFWSVSSADIFLC